MRKSLVPERASPTIAWREVSREPADPSPLAEVVVLETYRYFRGLAKGAGHVSTDLASTRRALSNALAEYRETGKDSLTLFFDGATVWVEGSLLRAPRSSHEAARELGTLCRAVEAHEFRLATDATEEGFRSLEPRLASFLRGEAPAPDTPIVSFLVETGASDARATGESEEVTETFEQACGTAVAILERMMASETLQAADFPGRSLMPSLARAAQVLVDVTDAPSAVVAARVAACARKWATAGSSASRAMRAAVVALAMGRAANCSRTDLASLALSALIREIAVVRAARRPDGMGVGKTPEEAAALLATANATGAAARARTALVFESLVLDTPGATLGDTPSLLAQMLYFARKFVDLVEASASESPQAQTIVQHIHDTQAGGLYLPILRLLASVLHVDLPTREQRRRLPSLSHGSALETTDTGAVHEGEIGRTPLPHVLVFMLDYRLTGTIVFREPEGAVHRIYFREGVPSLATSEPTRSDEHSEPRVLARIGAMLVARGLVNVADVERAAVDATSMGVRLGEYLVGERLVSRAQLDEALKAQLAERVVALANLPPTARYEYIADENLLSDAPGGEEPLEGRPLSILTQVVRVWRDRDRIERALRRVEADALELAVASRGVEVASSFDFEADETHVYERIAAGGARLVALLRMGVSIESVETVVSVLYMTRHLAVPGETRGPVFDASEEGRVARVRGSVRAQRQAEEAVREGDLQRAEAHASEAARLNPDERENKLLLAWLAAQQDPDLLSEAERLALELLEGEPESEFGLLYYARICRDAGRQGEARRIYDDLLRLFPENAAAAEERRAL